MKQRCLYGYLSFSAFGLFIFSGGRRVDSQISNNTTLMVINIALNITGRLFVSKDALAHINDCLGY